MPLAAGIPSRTPAQTAGTGVIVGTVIDPTGATIFGATVTLKDAATNAVRTASTNQAGRYDFPNLPPGKYDLIINYLSDPYLIVGDAADWGGLGGYTSVFNGLSAQANNPRAMEFGLRVRF